MYLKNLSVSPISSFLDSEFLQTVFTGLHMRKDFRNLIGHFCKSRSAQRGVLFWKAAAFFQDMYWNISGVLEGNQQNYSKLGVSALSRPRESISLRSISFVHAFWRLLSSHASFKLCHAWRPQMQPLVHWISQQ